MDFHSRSDIRVWVQSVLRQDADLIGDEGVSELVELIFKSGLAANEATGIVLEYMLEATEKAKARAKGQDGA